MAYIPDIKFDDMNIADKYTRGYDYERCKNGLWSIYNLNKKIMLNSGSRVVGTLNTVALNTVFKNNDMTSLVYTEKTDKKTGLPATKYLFELEKYGFIFSDLVTLKKDIPKNKLAAKDIQQFSFSYNGDDFCDVILGLKLFSDICSVHSGSNFLNGDIRIAFIDAPEIYVPPENELFYYLPDDQKKAAFAIHNKLEELGYYWQIEGENAIKYKHAKHKNLPFATIWTAERQWMLPDTERTEPVRFKFNLRNISKYEDYLSECTEFICQSMIESCDCYKSGVYDINRCVNGGGTCMEAEFTYQGKTYRKCLRYFCIFNDFSEQAIKSYIKLIDLENKELQNNK